MKLIDAKRKNGKIRLLQLFFDPAKPLTLNFMTDNGNSFVSLMNTCNNLGAAYSIENGNVQLGGIRSKLECLSWTISKRITVKLKVTCKVADSINKSSNNLPVLTITNANQVASFKAIAK